MLNITDSHTHTHAHIHEERREMHLYRFFKKKGEKEEKIEKKNVRRIFLTLTNFLLSYKKNYDK